MFDWVTWDNPVAIWWVALSTAGVFNIFLWIWTWYYGFKDIPITSLKKFWSEPKNIIYFSGIYVFVCAFRSFLPRADVQRICLFDTWFSSVLVGRTVATVAELAFIVQWVIVLRFLATQTKSHLALKISAIIFPIITMAEMFSWYAVIRTHYIGNAIEESLWALTYVLIGVAIAQIGPKLKGALKLAAGFAVLGCVFYVAFMTLVDVPMYVTRLMEDMQNQKPLLGFLEGLKDLNSRWVVTHDIQEWKTEIPWQTLYFTIAVLVSIAMCYVPLKIDNLKKYLKN